MTRSTRRPEIGPEVPRRGNCFSATAARLTMRAFRWTIAGRFPNTKKAVLLVVPHTSNWDFMVGVTTVFAMGIKTGFLGKHTMFRWPLRWFMRWMGGIPVDRSAATGVVAQVVKRFNDSDHLLLGLSPEGTRRKVERWKTGFYRIATEANVPIVPTSFDYARRMVCFGPVLMASGNISEDFAILESFFAGAQGRR